MTESDEKKMIEEYFNFAISEVDQVIKNIRSLYGEICTSNANLIAAWEGEAANAFKENSAVVEKNISQNIESIQNDLMQGLIRTKNTFINTDHQQATMISDTINTSSEAK